MTVFTCENSVEGILTCIYDAWASRLGFRNIRLLVEPITQPELFCTYQYVSPDSEKTASVIRSIKSRISPLAWQMVYRSAVSCDPDKADKIYRFLLYGFAYGSRTLQMLQEKSVSDLFELDRQVANEAHRFLEFIRFSDFSGGVLVSHISPRSDVLALTAPYFSDRMPSEYWIIIDDGRMTAAVHPKNETFYLTRLNSEEFAQLSSHEKDPYSDLWKTFFHSISIESRENPRCQKNFLPLWMRTHVTEFQ